MNWPIGALTSVLVNIGKILWGSWAQGSESLGIRRGAERGEERTLGRRQCLAQAASYTVITHWQGELNEAC